MATDKNRWQSSGSDQLDGLAAMAVNQDRTPRRKSPQMPPQLLLWGSSVLTELLLCVCQRRVQGSAGCSWKMLNTGHDMKKKPLCACCGWVGNAQLLWVAGVR